MSCEHECSFIIEFCLIDWLHAMCYNQIAPCGPITENKFSFNALVPWTSCFICSIVCLSLQCTLLRTNAWNPRSGLTAIHIYIIALVLGVNWGCCIRCKCMLKSMLVLSCGCVISGFFEVSINITDGDNQWELVEYQVQSSVIINDFAFSVQRKVIAYISLQLLFLIKCTCADGHFIHECMLECLTACVCLFSLCFASRFSYFVVAVVKRCSDLHYTSHNLLTDNQSADKQLFQWFVRLFFM